MTIINYGSGVTMTKSNALYLQPDPTVPVLDSISETSAEQGESVSIVLMGTNTNFNSSSKSIYLTNGTSYIYPSYISTGSATSVIAQFEFAYTDSIGDYSIYFVNSIDGTLSLTNAFTLLAGTNPPKVVSVNPDTVTIGETLDVEITTENIDLTQGTNSNKVTLTQGSFSKYFSISNSSTNSLSFNTTFSSDYPTGYYDVTVTHTSSGTSMLKTNGLYIQSNVQPQEPPTEAKGFDMSTGGYYTNIDSLITTDFAKEDVPASAFYYLKTVEATKEHSFTVNGSTVSFLYANSLSDKNSFRIYDDFLQPDGTDRIIKVTNLEIGDTVTLKCLSFDYSVTFVATNAEKSIYNLFADSTMLINIVATDTVITLTNIAGKYRLQKVSINEKLLAEPNPTYNLKDTSIYYVSDANFQNVSPYIFHIDTDSLTATVGGGDSIIARYSKFVFQDSYCTDTITVFDTVTVNVIDTITVTDTIKVTVMDTITVADTITVLDTVIVNDYQSVVDTLIITQSINVGTTEPTESVTVKVYPNPAKDFVIINVDDFEKINDYYLTISNLSGQSVYASLVNKKEQTIDIQNIGGKGIYYITFKDSDNKIFLTKKLIIQ